MSGSKTGCLKELRLEERRGKQRDVFQDGEGRDSETEPQVTEEGGRFDNGLGQR